MQAERTAPVNGEQQLLHEGWQIEDRNGDRHSIRKGGPTTYRIYIPPDYGQPNGSPIAWTLDDALAREAPTSDRSSQGVEFL